MTTCPDGHITIINRIISQPLTVSAATPAKPQPLEKFYRGEPLALGVKGTLGMNIISSLVAGCALILYLITLMEFNYYVCDLNPEHCRVYKLIRSCTLVLLLFTFLEFCISISTAAFGCKTVCWNSYSEVTVVIYQNMMPADNPTSATNAHTDGVACTPAPYKDLTP